MLKSATKVVIITEKLISKGVCEIIESCGASGYTIVAAGGKGSRNIRSTTELTVVVNDFSNVQIDVIVNDKETAEKIINTVAGQYFHNYSGITYLEEVDILRPEKFIKASKDKKKVG